MKIVWSAEAERALMEILDYIAENSIENGRRFIAKLRERADQLVLFPHSGRIVPEKPHEDLREIIEGNYRIFYRIKPKCIEIVTVFEGHRHVTK